MGSANTGLFVLMPVGGTLASCFTEVGNWAGKRRREPRIRCAWKPAVIKSLPVSCPATSATLDLQVNVVDRVPAAWLPPDGHCCSR